MHGDDKGEEVPNLDLDENSQTFGSFDNSEPVDAGAIEHSSDSDFDPSNQDNTEALLEAAATAEKSLGRFSCKLFYVELMVVICR